jgi:hypothetical protein
MYKRKTVVVVGVRVGSVNIVDRHQVIEFLGPLKNYFVERVGD